MADYSWQPDGTHWGLSVALAHLCLLWVFVAGRQMEYSDRDKTQTDDDGAWERDCIRGSNKGWDRREWKKMWRKNPHKKWKNRNAVTWKLIGLCVLSTSHFYLAHHWGLKWDWNDYLAPVKYFWREKHDYRCVHYSGRICATTCQIQNFSCWSICSHRLFFLFMKVHKFV